VTFHDERIGARSGVRAVHPHFAAPPLADEIRGDAVEPGSGVRARGVVTAPAPEGDEERVGDGVVGGVPSSGPIEAELWVVALSLADAPRPVHTP
jgi:hypothetical protein